ncbi:hypothetical protein PIB30_039031 [Stylosanthes scabra]|uniref:Aminotransferase-like plant mobile domain-containing protein n=1 Tax=Stylosanthes scabra TaxID=79078 RepID=A0ABU6RES4_9FABA|nr:hypothetical protein [Stylosanthes scabra]
MIRDPYINRMDASHHIAGEEGFQTPRCLTSRGVVPNMPPPECLVEYIHEAGFGGPLELRKFEYDMSVLSALVERWRPETQFPYPIRRVHNHAAGCGISPWPTQRWRPE